MTSPAPTARPDEGAVSWNINTACNYRCSYCSQRFKEDRGRWSRDTPRFLAAFARLPGRWEVKISGGEPFVHPTLTEIISGLARIGHRVSIVTNFSASREKLSAFCDAARGRVGVFSCSLHLEYVTDLDAFIARAQWMSSRLAASADASLPAPSLNVTSVATHATLARMPEINARFERAGVVFKVQPEKLRGAVVAYSSQERAALITLGGHNRTGSISHHFEGLPCWAGARYFILDDEGEAFRCYPARRAKIERMGSFLSDDFRLDDDARPCRYRYCDCTVPIERAMMPRDHNAVESP